MRRNDKEITDIQAIEDIIRRSSVCRLALLDNGMPYVIPLCFGYAENVLYFHAASEGRKLDILRKNKHVCFEFDIDQEIIRGENACNWSMKYRSVIGVGTATILDDPESKAVAFRRIMQQYGADEPFEFSTNSLQKTVIIKVDIGQMSGKMSGYTYDSENL